MSQEGESQTNATNNSNVSRTRSEQTLPPTLREKLFSGPEFKGEFDPEERTSKNFRSGPGRNNNLWGGSFWEY